MPLMDLLLKKNKKHQAISDQYRKEIVKQVLL